MVGEWGSAILIAYKDMTNETKIKPEKMLLLTSGKKPDETVVENPYKEDVFDIYVLWKSLPPLLKNPPAGPRGKPNAREFAESQGFDDDEILRLISIPSQTAFAAEFNLNINTLTEWNKKIKKEHIIQHTKGWALDLMPNIIMSMYSSAMKKNNPLTYKLLLQTIADFQEKAVIDHRFKPIDKVEFVLANEQNVKEKLDANKANTQS